MDVGAVTLEGSVVRLEPMRVEHYDAFVQIGLGHDIFRWYPFAVDNAADMLVYVRRCLAAAHRRHGRGHTPQPHDLPRRTPAPQRLLQHHRHRVAGSEAAT